MEARLVQQVFFEEKSLICIELNVFFGFVDATDIDSRNRVQTLGYT